jgi:hypothetical protein
MSPDTALAGPVPASAVDDPLCTSEDVYSLWSDPVNFPVRVTLSTLWKHVADPDFVITATPAWHRP